MSERLISHGTIVAARLRRARTSRERMRGLLRRPPLEEGEGLLIERARRIHTLGMSYPIDVVFCDGDLEVLHVVHEMPPHRLTRFVRRARVVFELPPGAARSIREGDRLQVDQGSASER